MRRRMRVSLAVLLFTAPGCIVVAPWPNKDDSRGVKVAKIAGIGALATAGILVPLAVSR
jgi:hypothetical protein